jgi:hypothetical protein
MTYTYKEAIYADDTNNRIDCFLYLPEHGGWVPYTLDVDDTDMTIDNTVLLAQMQEANDIAPYVAPEPPTQDELDAISASEIRSERDALLSNFVDPLVTNPLRWAELTDAKQAEWTQYRTDLLNVPQQAGFPNTVTWPTRPT